MAIALAVILNHRIGTRLKEVEKMLSADEAMLNAERAKPFQIIKLSDAIYRCTELEKK